MIFLGKSCADFQKQISPHLDLSVEIESAGRLVVEQCIPGHQCFREFAETHKKTVALFFIVRPKPSIDCPSGFDQWSSNKLSP